MDFKKKCIQFKKNAKEFGYDLKLTHVQELLSKLEGFENRHAKLASEIADTKVEKEAKGSGVFMYVTTDDNVLEKFLEIDEDSWQWILKNDNSAIELFLQEDYGPDFHTDNFLYNVKNQNLDIIREYLSVLGKANRSVGYSVSIDSVKFKEWVQNNKNTLKELGYQVE